MSRRLNLKKQNQNPLQPHWSSWMITINTNSTDKRLMGPLRKTWVYITQNLKDFTYTLIPGARLLEVGSNPHIEVGDELHRVHLHDHLIIQSQGIGYLDYSKIRAFIKKQLERFGTFKNEYFQAQLVNNFNASVYIKSYNEKNAELDLDEPEIDFEIIL